MNNRQTAELLRQLADYLDPPPTIDGMQATYEALQGAGVRDPHLTKLASITTAGEVTRWLDYLVASDIPDEHHIGYMIKRLYAGDAAPEVVEESDYERLKRKYVPPGWEHIIEH